MKLGNRKISFRIILVLFIVCMAIYNTNYIGKKMTPIVKDITFEILEKNIYVEINNIFKGQYVMSNFTKIGRAHV